MPTTTDVLVVGAGPAGLATATALAQAGAAVTVVDSAPGPDHTSRAAVVHARTLEVLDRIGAAAPLVAAGIPARRFTIRNRDRILVPIDFDGLPTAYPYALMVPQSTTEAVLNDRLTAAGGRVLRGVEAVGLDGNTVTFAGGDRITATHIVAADGMHSTIRRLAGIGFGGPSTPGESFVLADVKVDGGPMDEVILYLSRAGLLVWAPLPDGTVRLVAAVPDAPENPDKAYTQSLLAVRGPSRPAVQVTDVVWGSRFRVHHRVADTFRAGPVLLVGDAAHVHSPAGGQGMNLGLRDALALSDALLTGTDTALNTYATDRRPKALDVVHFASRLTRLATVPPAARPLRNAALATLAHLPTFRTTLAYRLSALHHPSN